MRRAVAVRGWPALALLATLALFAALAPAAGPACAEPAPTPAPAPANAPPSPAQSVDARTWVDHDGRPIAQPPDWEDSFWGHQFHQCVTAELAHAFDVPDKLLALANVLGARTRREAVNVNAFDEVPNSTWFTNRNALRSVPCAELRQGPDPVVLPAKPWTVVHRMKGGTSLGFVIKDGPRRWLVKLDPLGYPQLASGADMVVRTLLHAAGYNVPHNEPVRFRRADLAISPDLLSGAKGEQLTEAELDSMLARGAVNADGSQAAYASQYLPGHVLGSPSMNRRRPGDANDWYAHANRRELRGLFVLASWLGFWDTKDPNFLDTFVAGKDSTGHVDHYLLDSKSALGARSTGPKWPWQGYEETIDLGWTARRLLSLGFAIEPWRRARQESGIPSVGNFESDVYEPARFAPEIPHLAFRALTDRDAYWGAKLVASFSDAQIAAAVEAAHYDDPRAGPYLVRALVARRDKVERYWFARTAPLDFFAVDGDTLRFHDLAVDIGLAPARAYAVEIEAAAGSDGGAARQRVRLDAPALPLVAGDAGPRRLALELAIAGDGARPARVELARTAQGWLITRVRHG